MNVSTEASANRTCGDRRPRSMYTNTATNMQTLDKTAQRIGEDTEFMTFTVFATPNGVPGTTRMLAKKIILIHCLHCTISDHN